MIVIGIILMNSEEVISVQRRVYVKSENQIKKKKGYTKDYRELARACNTYGLYTHNADTMGLYHWKDSLLIVLQKLGVVVSSNKEKSLLT